MSDKLPEILIDYNPVLSASEAKRIQKHAGCYETIRLNLAKNNTEREVQIFLHNELQREDGPRNTVINRLCGQLLRMQARRKRKELITYAKKITRKGH